MVNSVKTPKEILQWEESFESSNKETFWYPDDPDFGGGAGPKVCEHDFGTIGDDGHCSDSSKTKSIEDDRSLDKITDAQNIDENGDSQDLDSNQDFEVNDPVPISTRTTRSGNKVLTEIESEDENEEEDPTLRCVFDKKLLVRDCIPHRSPELKKNEMVVLTQAIKDWIFFALKYEWKLKVRKENPKTRGTKSRIRYEDYKIAKTLGEMLKFGATKADIMHDYRRGFIEFDSTSNITVEKLIDDYLKKNGDKSNISAYKRINGIETYEGTIRT
mmetsp:Transcript_11119/g.14400  ORF Transcript_11119/g.14400 Transcript_11119/m.14400 type:complete len:273 (+) Transcript_11119:725-1543(+)